MKKNSIMLGDIITTKATAECGEGKTGIIICRHNENENIYGVKFNETHESFHKLQYGKKHIGLLNENKGLWLELKDFKLIPLLNEDKRKFNDLMLKGYAQSVEAIPKEIERSTALIKSCKTSIADRLRYNKQQENEIKEHTKKIENLTKMPKPEPDNFCLIYDKLKKHKDIKNIIVKDDYIIVQTNDLTYHHTKPGQYIPDFNLGAYYVFIPNSLGNEVRIINYKRQMSKGHYSHPCVRDNGYVCMGDTVRAGVNNYRKENQLSSLIYLLINFLKEPNYGTPYRSATDFRCAQPTTYKPKDILKYLDSWRNHEKWDEKLFYEHLMKGYESDIKYLQNKKDTANFTTDESHYLEMLNDQLYRADQYYENNWGNGENNTDNEEEGEESEDEESEPGF